MSAKERIHRAIDIIPLQLFSGSAFVAALYATVSCDFFSNNVIFDALENDTEKRIGFGTFSRESSSVSDVTCSLYTTQDYEMLSDAYFKVAVYCTSIATSVGAFNFLYSLFMWCGHFSRGSIIYKVGIYFVCIICASASQFVYLTKTCNINDCNTLPDGTSGSTCFESRCTPGKGALSSYFAIVFWLICVVCLIRLIRIEQRKSGTINELEANHIPDHGDCVEVKVSNDKCKTVLHHINIERMETEESFETVLSCDEECADPVSPVEYTRRQKWTKRMQRDFMRQYEC